MRSPGSEALLNRARLRLPGADGGVARSSAASASERALIANLELTSYFRGADALHTQAQGGDRVSWFTHRVAGMPFGLVECVHAQSDAPSPVLGPLWETIAANGDIIKMVRLRDRGLDTAPDDRAWERAGFWRFSFERKLREVLPLADDYDATLASLGKHTRRNMRNVRRLAEDAGLRATRVLGANAALKNEIVALGARNKPSPLSPQLIQRFETYAELSGKPFRSALRTCDGALMSYALGYLDAGAARLLYQLNDGAWHRLSPSLLHRAFMIERFTLLGYKEIGFVHGCAGVLAHSCEELLVDETWLIRRSISARALSLALSMLIPGTGMLEPVRRALQSAALRRERGKQ